MRIKHLLVAALMTLCFGTMAYAETITIDGSTTVDPIIQLCVEKFKETHPDVTLTISATGSGDGIKALIEGNAQIAMASRPIKDSEMDYAEENSVEPYEIVIAKDAILPVVHPSNPVADLTVEQLNQIYTGATENWSQVGGEDSSITVFSRESSSGTYGTWEEFVMEDSELSSAAQYVNSNGAMREKVAANPKAIGYIGVGYLDDSTRAVAVGGVTGSMATVLDGSYPFARNLHLYTNGEPTGIVKEFIDFVLGPEGQALVTEAGFVALQ